MRLNDTFKKMLPLLWVGTMITSCDDFLHKEPPSYVVPSDYYKTEAQIQACANAFYADILPSHGGGYGRFSADSNTDNQAGISSDSKYVVGEWKTNMSNGNWSWGTIRNLNYQITTVEAQLEAGQISGSESNTRHYLGEMYFFRAYKYFDMLQNWGDFPIVTEVLPDDETTLVEANKRMPRNEVARFILAELDKSLEYLKDGFAKTRISPDAARVLKSRVALFEGSWLTYFKGTPFVPQGKGWPGKAKDYNADYQYPSGSIDEEIKFFLGEAVSAAEEVAEKYKGSLSKNNCVLPQSASDPNNPYFSLFGSSDMSGYPEVLLWRQYSRALSIGNNVESAVQWGNEGTGLTRSMVEGFLMEDGKPIYASGFTYDDTTLDKVRTNRDPRLALFLKVPGQTNLFLNMDYSEGDLNVNVEPIPAITNGSWEKGYSTGYTIRKGGSFDRKNCVKFACTTASIVFRATEALLNYMEANYMLTGNLSAGKTLEYWKIIRETAGFTGVAIDPQITIAATDITKEALDWGAYSGGKLLTDPILYNIRRERRCELMAEGLRWMDLIRWRALDQMVTTPYHVEGFHLWNTPMEDWYDFTAEDYDGSSSASVSSPELSEYYRLYEKNQTAGNLFKDGYRWTMAQYLQPMPIKQMMLTASDYASVELSPLYQNPYWPTVSNVPAEQ